MTASRSSPTSRASPMRGRRRPSSRLARMDASSSTQSLWTQMERTCANGCLMTACGTCRSSPPPSTSARGCASRATSTTAGGPARLSSSISKRGFASPSTTVTARGSRAGTCAPSCAARQSATLPPDCGLLRRSLRPTSRRALRRHLRSCLCGYHSASQAPRRCRPSRACSWHYKMTGRSWISPLGGSRASSRPSSCLNSRRAGLTLADTP
mmetsp:Transcript_5329/g.16305  ORF Transcript_5329/g.16305 Transcript_5329/m.16305 type:complete len:211 (-) Transcript_5329:5795-6427(-)